MNEEEERMGGPDEVDETETEKKDNSRMSALFWMEKQQKLLEEVATTEIIGKT